MATDDEAYQELAAYTLGLHDAAFIHQHIVDAYAVHAAMPTDKPIRIAQALGAVPARRARAHGPRPKAGHVLQE
jgi:hypothetical protein